MRLVYLNDLFWKDICKIGGSSWGSRGVDILAKIPRHSSGCIGKRVRGSFSLSYVASSRRNMARLLRMEDMRTYISSILCSILVSLAVTGRERADVLLSFSQLLDCSDGSQNNHRLPRLLLTPQENIAFTNYASQIGEHLVRLTLYVVIVVHRLLRPSTASFIDCFVHQLFHPSTA